MSNLIYNMKKYKKGDMMENKELKEKIYDLEFKNLKIIQKENGFRFGIDSVLLSDFAKSIKKNSIVMDIGTGTGIIGILLCAKTNLKKIYGIEIQKEMAEMARRSVELNSLQEKFEILNYDINNINEVLKKETFDYIVSNPPYKKIDTGLINENENKLISRHEIKCNIEDIARVAFRMLKDKGELYMIHRPERLVDVLSELRKYKLEPKSLRFVHSKVNEAPKMFLIRAVKNGKAFLKVESPLYIYEENGEYTEEVLKIYNKI